MRATCQRSVKRRGNLAVEFALGWVLLWAIFGGLYQFGYSFYLYNGLQSAVADGAMLASRLDFDSRDTDAFSSNIKNMVVYGSITAGTTPLVPNLSTANVSVVWSADAKGIPQAVTVRIVNFAIAALFKSFLLSNKPACTVKYAGNYLS